MARSKSSGRWLNEHFNDPYVKKSQQEGYRSRASYKLLEIQKKDQLIKPGMILLDLGAAPGGWSQVAVELVGKKGCVIASDILPMEPLEGVEFIQGDFSEDEAYQQILALLSGRSLDLVISDMAPNMSGINAVDQARSMYLVELALEMATQVLRPGGCFLAKVFQGAGFDELLAALRSKFDKVQSRKPDASRARSREKYIIAKGFRA
ncbi:MAG: 23S rRNA (uridine(2552)-2'-O)-methyltransferase RlmE [Pseudomonadales bacterium]|nr:23S rRNA (uridine(2552)-2'-O)-methyltransferase RlmE [Pseudomonadales bacterium]MCP5216201.1 23S rRNA (uridine(2552)-2'-O)-methyltransferase RlmE [Pseudomonadales bacterium]